MNAATPAQLAHIAEQDIEERRASRSVTLRAWRDRLRCFIRQNGRMNAAEAQQFICTLGECLGDDIREIREQLTEISMNCEAITYYRPAAND